MTFAPENRPSMETQLFETLATTLAEKGDRLPPRSSFPNWNNAEITRPLRHLVQKRLELGRRTTETAGFAGVRALSTKKELASGGASASCSCRTAPGPGVAIFA